MGLWHPYIGGGSEVMPHTRVFFLQYLKYRHCAWTWKKAELPGTCPVLVFIAGKRLHPGVHVPCVPGAPAVNACGCVSRSPETIK